MRSSKREVRAPVRGPSSASTRTSKWLARYVAFAAASGIPAAQAARAAEAIQERLPILSPEQDEALLRAAGFVDVDLFYVGFTFRGWVAYTP